MASKSQNGYPAIYSERGTKNYNIPIKGGPRRNLRLRAGNSDSAMILAHLALRFAEKIERPSRTFDWWGWNYRRVTGGGALSNHASATAIDLNATQHPYGRRNTFSVVQRAKIRWTLRIIYRNTVRWGGDYSGTKDEMHYEMRRNQKKAARVARRLRKSPRGKRILKAN